MQKYLKLPKAEEPPDYEVPVEGVVIWFDGTDVWVKHRSKPDPSRRYFESGIVTKCPLTAWEVRYPLGSPIVTRQVDISLARDGVHHEEDEDGENQ